MGNDLVWTTELSSENMIPFDPVDHLLGQQVDDLLEVTLAEARRESIGNLESRWRRWPNCSCIHLPWVKPRVQLRMPSVRNYAISRSISSSVSPSVSGTFLQKYPSGHEAQEPH